MPKEKPLIDLVGCEHVIRVERCRDGRLFENRAVLDKVLKTIDAKVKRGKAVALEANPLVFWQCRLFSRMLEGKKGDIRIPKSFSKKTRRVMEAVLEKFSRMNHKELLKNIPRDALFLARLIGELEKRGTRAYPIDSKYAHDYYLKKCLREDLLYGHTENEEKSIFESLREEHMAKKIAKLASGPEQVRLAVLGVYHVQNVSIELKEKGFRTKIHSPVLLTLKKEKLNDIWLRRYCARNKRKSQREEKKKKVFMLRFRGKLRKPALPKPKTTKKK